MRPEREALGGLSYSSLLGAARAGAAALAERGVSSGDRVALALEPGRDLVAALHGCFLVGAVAVPIDLRLRQSERERWTAGTALVVQEPLAESAEVSGGSLAGSADLYAGSLAGSAGLYGGSLELTRTATVMHTSGTTAAPR